MFASRQRSEPPAAVRVLIADDQTAYAEALKIILALHDRLEVVGHAGDGAEAVELALALRPDVVLMDVHMPTMDGVEATERIASLLPSTRVLMLTASTDPADVDRARKAGALGYLAKGCAARDLVKAILDAASAPSPRRRPAPGVDAIDGARELLRAHAVRRGVVDDDFEPGRWIAA